MDPASAVDGTARLHGLLSRLEVDIIAIERDVRRRGERYEPIVQAFGKFYCIYAGRGIHEAGGQEIPVQAGDLVFVPRGQRHVDNPASQATYSKFFCHFDARSAGLELGAFLDLPPVVRPGRRFREARSLFADLFALHHAPEPSAALRANARLREIIALYLDAVPAESLGFRWTPPLARLDRVVTAMSEDLRHQHRLTDLARLAGVHPSHLCRLFTRSVGIPPHRFLKRLRLRRAQELLRTTDLAVEAIATAIGFANAQHFTRAFSEEFSVPPAHFRRMGEPASGRSRPARD